MKRLPGAVLLGLVYCLALGSVKPLDFATGAVVGLLALWGLGLGSGPLPLGELARRTAAFPLFAFAVGRKVLSGALQVALIVVGLRSPPRAGIVSIPLEERSPTAVAVAALALTLSPGEVLVGIDWERRRMLVHAIDASDPEALRARHQELYERFQRRVFP